MKYEAHARLSVGFLHVPSTRLGLKLDLVSTCAQPTGVDRAGCGCMDRHRGIEPLSCPLFVGALTPAERMARG